MSDSDYEGGELSVDINEMRKLLEIVFGFFTHSSHFSSYEALYEAMMDGLAYIYFCRRQWRRSSLLTSLEPELREAVTSQHASQALEQFNFVADEHLFEVLDHFVRGKLAHNPHPPL